jgi:ERCC4-type nuclease
MKPKKQIENIFSSTPVEKEEKCPNPKIPIIIDTREKQSLIASNLINKKTNTKFEKLDIGDYLIQDTIIERKTFSDLLSSITDKRIFKQLPELKKYKNYLLLIEGFYYNYSDFNIHENAIRGLLTSISLDYKIPIIYTEDENDTSKFLITLAKRYEKPRPEISMRPAKNTSSIEEQKKFILEGFPGIGPTKSKKLLEKFQNLQNIFNASSEELETIERFHKSQIDEFKRLLES